ncbi:MAG TPA: hypothetical protein VF175_08640 [Lacipirellula sp.]
MFSVFRGLLFCTAAAAALSAGCYNAEVLLKARSEAAKVIRMEEVELGAFAITLPHKLGEATDHIVEFHVFGLVESRDRKQVTRALQTRGPELRARMLVSVRSLADADFDEPKLTKFRKTIADVINGALKEDVIKRVGFYHYSFGTFN